MGRAVVFNTTETSWHGHPDPLACPESRYRRSLALYYFTVPEPGGMRQHTTVFKARPGSHDRPNLRDVATDWARDLCPPILWRAFSRRQRP
jgi:hypothetical protein